MKRKPRANSNFARTIAQKSLLKNRRGRLVAFIVVAIVAAAAAFMTVSFAQSKRRARPAPADKLYRAQESRIPRRSSPEKDNPSGRLSRRDKDRDDQEGQEPAGPLTLVDAAKQKRVRLRPKEVKLARAHSFDGDLRNLPYVPEPKRERPEREMPPPPPAALTNAGSEAAPVDTGSAAAAAAAAAPDRKSTRLNSSHANISYAVFCLKKKKNKHNRMTLVQAGVYHAKQRSNIRL